MKVYLVQDQREMGRVMAVCAEKESAELLARTLTEDRGHPFVVNERTLVYGQPTLGYNP